MNKVGPRHLARSLAIQGIYYYKINKCDILEIKEYLKQVNLSIYNKSNLELMHYLIEEGSLEFDKMLEFYKPFLKCEIKEITLIEQIIMVIAALELKNSLNIHKSIIINEGIELAKLFGGPDSHKFINTVLDKLANSIRPHEINNKLVK